MSIAERLARPEILALEPYAHPAFDPTLERLDANESPWRPAGDRSDTGLNRYPETAGTQIEAVLAALYGVPATQVLAGRGSDEGIDLLTRAFLRPYRDSLLQCPPTFGMYALACRLQGATLIDVPLDRTQGFALRPADIRTAFASTTRLIFLCSPNNPTGNRIPLSLIADLCREVAEQALVVVDEAYAEFTEDPGALTLLGEHANLVVLRTLSKAYGLAGARCGAVIAAADVIAVLRRIRPPYFITTGTSEAVMRALSPAGIAEARARIQTLCTERKRLAAALETLALIRHVFPSTANFLLVECTEATEVLARARRAGFLLRDFSRQPHTRGCVRISIGSEDQNDRLLSGLATP